MKKTPERPRSGCNSLDNLISTQRPWPQRDTTTPQGVGAAMKPPVFLQPGDTVTIDIEKIGALTNPVVAER
ncbi:MAG: fumarylacetoacetate hydrolase family protein [Verrucomicrobiales bacterium]